MINKEGKRMRLVSIHAIVAVLVFGIAINATGLVNAQNLDIITDPPIEWPPLHTWPVVARLDYGNVVVGESKAITFNFSSNVGSEVGIYILGLKNDSSNVVSPMAPPLDGPPYYFCWESFCFDPDTYPLSISYSPTPHISPNIIPLGECVLFDITFTPDSLGEHSLYMYLRSDDSYYPPGVVAYINLVGNGVNGPTPEEQIETVQEFFDDAVTAGELVGVAKTETAAAGKLNALEHMLEQAEYLIDIGDMEGACAQLHSAYKKTDGLWPPPDFVTGPAAEELATMIQDVMESLGCE